MSILCDMFCVVSDLCFTSLQINDLPSLKFPFCSHRAGNLEHDLCFMCRRVALPRLDNGDWLLFPKMGAYTLCGASNFNGIPAAEVPTFYVKSQLQ